MPLILPQGLPVIEQLEKEGFEIFDANEPYDISLALVNLMPQKQRTELQFLRLLGNTNLRIKILLTLPRGYTSHSTSSEYFGQYYTSIESVIERKIDACIITGAPLEHINFEEVRYWKAMEEIFEWTKNHVTSTLHICWGSMAGLSYHFGIGKELFSEKLFGVFEHKIITPKHPLMRGINSNWTFPQARNAGSNFKGQTHGLLHLCQSTQVGIGLLASHDGKLIFLSGHPEYDKIALHDEFQRDLQMNPFQKVPQNYYREDKVQEGNIDADWETRTKIFFRNWIQSISQ